MEMNGTSIQFIVKMITFSTKPFTIIWITSTILGKTPTYPNLKASNKMVQVLVVWLALCKYVCEHSMKIFKELDEENFVQIKTSTCRTCRISASRWLIFIYLCEGKLTSK